MEPSKAIFSIIIACESTTTKILLFNVDRIGKENRSKQSNIERQ